MRSPVPIVDCHGHLGVHPDFPAYKGGPEEMIAVMDLLNIERLAISSTLAIYNDCPRGNAQVSELVQRCPDRFLGYVVVNPNAPDEALEQLQLFAGLHTPPLIKLHPDTHKYPATGANYRPIWEYAHQNRAVVLSHTWDSDSNCGPPLLGAMAREFPRVRVILGHSGVTWRGYEQSLEAAESAPNVFLDLAGSQSHRTIVEHCVARIGAERVLFGSDMPYLEAAMALGRVLTTQISDRQKEMILRENFLRILAEA